MLACVYLAVLSHVAIRVHAHACVLSRVWLFVTPWTVALWLLCPWDLPGKNTRVGCHLLLQGIFVTQGLKPLPPVSPELQADSLPLSHQGSTDIHVDTDL